MSGTSSTSDDTADRLRQEMASVRRDLGADIHDVAAHARELADWRSYVQKAPWTGMAVAAAIGFVAVPRKLHVDTVDADELARLARQKRVVVESKPKAAAKSGLGSTVFRLVSGIVLRTAVGIATQKAAQMMNPEDSATMATTASGTGTAQ